MAKGLLYRKLQRLIDEDELLQDIRKDISKDKLAQRICNGFRLNKKEAKVAFSEIRLKRVNRFKVARR